MLLTFYFHGLFISNLVFSIPLLLINTLLYDAVKKECVNFVLKSKREGHEWNRIQNTNVEFNFYSNSISDEMSN